MHRIRTWARAKAHGPSPLVAVSRRVSNRHQNTDPPPANPTTDAPPTTVPTEPKQDETEQTPTPAGSKASRADKKVLVRFYLTIKDILFSSIINVLLVFVPVGIAVEFSGAPAGIVFAMNAIAIIPLAGLLSHATESVARRLGDTIGALMNVTFGNAVELIIFIIALVKNEIRIVQASLLGSILANLLLILGMCFLLGGLRFREQIYNSTVTQMSACLLSLSVTSLLLPTAFHASFSNYDIADDKVLQVSRGTSVVLLLVYGLYLLFQLNSHAYMYESTPQHIIERESVPGPAAQYFNSSSSSDTSSSSSSDTEGSVHSATTAKKIKRMIKKRRRNRKPSTASQQASSSRSAEALPSEVALELEMSTTSERTGRDHTGTLPLPEGSTAVVDDEMDEADETPSHPKEHRKKHKHRHHRHPRTNSGDGGSVTHTWSAPEQGEPGQRRVDFAVAPDIETAQDLEAQTGTTRPKLFSLRSLRPPIPKAMMQNVFTAPPQNPVAGASSPEPLQRGQLRRATSLPPQAHGQIYRMPPGAVPPIIPVIVNATPKVNPADGEEEDLEISRTTAILLLLISTALIAVCAEFMVDSISDVIGDGSGVSEAFIGLIILPIVGNAAEHVTAVTVAMKNKMDLAIGVALGSSIQIALFVTPLVVILGWIMNKEMSLYFTLFETVSMFVSAFIVNFLVLDGRSNYLEGALLCSAYVIIAVAAFFYPNAEAANSLGGGQDGSGEAVVSGAKALAPRIASLVGLWK